MFNCNKKANSQYSLFPIACCLLTGLVLLFSPLATLAGVEVLFSPRDNINYRIIEAINLSEDYIDVAAFDFTSREIADALLNAKRKGLRVRLLVDKKLLLEDSDSQAKYLEEKGIDTKGLKGKGEGVMKNSFIIFDGRLVMVGPYHLPEDKESYDYENAIFFDDIGIVETYQNEFDRLFGKKSMSTTAPEKAKESLLSTVIKPSSAGTRQEPGSALHEKPDSGVQSIESRVRSRESELKTQDPGVGSQESEIRSQKPEVGGQDSSLKTPDSSLKTPDSSLPTQDVSLPPVEPVKSETEELAFAAPGALINISFEELDKVFGKESALSEAEKSALWPKYMGRYVKWTGEVTYTMLGLIKGTRIGLRHKSASGGSGSQRSREPSDADVEVRFSIKKAPKIMRIAEGDTIIYTAKLFTYPTSNAPYYVLNEGSME